MIHDDQIAIIGMEKRLISKKRLVNFRNFGKLIYKDGRVKNIKAPCYIHSAV